MNHSRLVHSCHLLSSSLQPQAINMIPAQMQIPGLDLSASVQTDATDCLCLMNMVTTDELMDDDDYEGDNI